MDTSGTDGTSASALALIKEADTTNIPKPNPDIFEPAADLDTFRHVDPSKFEWVNPDEIEAGGTTCGFLKAPFGWPAGSETGFKETDTQTEYPLAKVCELYLYWYMSVCLPNFETSHISNVLFYFHYIQMYVLSSLISSQLLVGTLLLIAEGQSHSHHVALIWVQIA